MHNGVYKIEIFEKMGKTVKAANSVRFMIFKEKRGEKIMIGDFELIFEEFIKMFPINSDNILNWEPIDDLMILIRYKDGSVRTYDYIEKTSSYGRTETRLKEKTHTETEDAWRTLFATRLRRKIYLKGYTQEELSIDTGISQSSLSRYTDGLATPSAWVIARLCKALDCNEHDLICFD